MAESNDARTNSTQQLDQLDQLGKFMMIVVMNVGFPLLAFFSLKNIVSPRKTKQSLSDSECSLKTTGENFDFGKSQRCTAS